MDWNLNDLFFGGGEYVDNNYWYVPINQIDNQSMLQNYSDYYQNQNPRIADIYWWLAKNAGIWGNTQRNILNRYDALANDVNTRQSYITDMSGAYGNDLLNDINNQRDYIYSLYWPNGSITNEVNDYYSWLANAIAWDTWRQLAQNDVNARDIGMSVWANRNTQNDIYNEWYQRMLQAKEQDINAKNNIIAALQQYTTNLRQEYWNTADQFIIQKWQQANDLMNNLSSSVAQQMVELENAKLQYALTPKSSSGWNSNNLAILQQLGNYWLTQLISDQNLTEKNYKENPRYNIVKWVIWDVSWDDIQQTKKDLDKEKEK